MMPRERVTDLSISADKVESSDYSLDSTIKINNEIVGILNRALIRQFPNCDCFLMGKEVNRWFLPWAIRSYKLKNPDDINEDLVSVFLSDTQSLAAKIGNRLICNEVSWVRYLCKYGYGKCVPNYGDPHNRS